MCRFANKVIIENASFSLHVTCQLEERRGSSVSMSLSSNVERLQSIAMEHHDDEVDHGAPDIPTAKMTRNQR